MILEHQISSRAISRSRGNAPIRKICLLSAMEIATWLHNEGWEAKPLIGPMATTLTMIPAAIAAGFGELEKHDSIINP